MNPGTLLPLLPEGPADACLAFHDGQPVSRAAFLRDVATCAARIPPGQPLINLCGDRYLFAVGFFAAMQRQALCLMPNAVTREVLARLASEHPGLAALSDGGVDTHGLPLLPLARSLSGSVPADTPALPAGQVVARLFTSGSTGQPQAHDKTWGKLVLNTRLAAEAQWARSGGPCAVLATVPAQHMFGFESSVLLPLLGGGILMPQHPLLPADIVSALGATPAPRALVSTPYHLHMLMESGLPLPPCRLVICATAPLSLTLAARIEAATGGVLGEIYGSTETGQIATRRPSQSEVWECLRGVSLHREQDTTHASAPHIEHPVALGDLLDMQAPGPEGRQRFLLRGRLGDMINIAGKRSSLGYLDSVLKSLPGVEDGAFHLPDEAGPDGVTRLAAFAVAPGLSAADIRRALREHLDAVFMPRPLLLLPRLPRNSAGKLPRAALEALLRDTDSAA